MAPISALSFAFGGAIGTAISWFLLIYLIRFVASFTSFSVQKIIRRDPEQVFSDERWKSFHYKSTAAISVLGFLVNFFTYTP